eukprot:9122649-Karenia_brevis.AAC.1
MGGTGVSRNDISSGDLPGDGRRTSDVPNVKQKCPETLVYNATCLETAGANSPGVKFRGVVSY